MFYESEFDASNKNGTSSHSPYEQTHDLRDNRWVDDALAHVHPGSEYLAHCLRWQDCEKTNPAMLGCSPNIPIRTMRLAGRIAVVFARGKSLERG